MIPTNCRTLRHHPKVLNLHFKPEVKRADRANLVDAYVRGELVEEFRTRRLFVAFEHLGFKILESGG